MTHPLKTRLTRLYTGSDRRAVHFRYALIVFDFATILYFIVIAGQPVVPWIIAVDMALGVLILADLGARLWIAPDRRAVFWRVYTLADLVVVVSLVLEPFIAGSFGFLRILRGLRLIHSYHLLADLRRDSRFFRRHENAVIAAINLFVFVFLTTSTVHALFFRPTGEPYSYVDALYFTVATLTTTGFGDITLSTPAGKLFSVFVMVVGVTLFVQLARAILQPPKVRYTCRGCGLTRHDLDAVHCKHCGERLKIRTPGAA